MTPFSPVSNNSALAGLAGRGCRVIGNEQCWTFCFGSGSHLETSLPWRLVSKDGISCGDSDEALQFRDGERLQLGSLANHLLEHHKVSEVSIADCTGDIHITFSPELALDIFNNSSVREGWQIHLGGPGEQTRILGSSSYTSFAEWHANDG